MIVETFIFVFLFGTLNSVDCGDVVNNVCLNTLGLGYDALKGDPHTSTRDPGMKRPVFLLRDDKDFTVMDFLMCSSNYDAKEISDQTSLSKSFSETVSFTAPVPFAEGLAFSMGETFQNMHSSATEKDEIFIKALANCIFKKAFLSENVLKPSDYFISAVTNLPANLSDVVDYSYADFFNEFGTHYIVEVVLGSRMVTVRSISREVRKQMKEDNFNVAVGVEAKDTVGLKSNTNSSKSEITKYDNYLKSVDKFFVGAPPPEENNSDWGNWVTETKNSPAVIAFTLTDLRELFDVKIFEKLTTKELEIKKKNLGIFYRQMCSSVPSCSESFSNNLDNFDINLKIGEITNEKHISCDPGYTLLSCGIRDDDFVDDWRDFKDLKKTLLEPHLNRYAIPVSGADCKCFDLLIAKCVARCSRKVKGFEIVETINTGIARCPEGKRLLGCHAMSATKQPFKHEFYPEDDAMQCKCTDPEVKCIATCAENIKQSYVKSTYIENIPKISLHMYGGKCTAPCSNQNPKDKSDYENYNYCYDEKDEWHYCSPSEGVDRYNIPCKGRCGGHGYGYYWCNNVRDTWDYCSLPRLDTEAKEEEIKAIVKCDPGFEVLGCGFQNENSKYNNNLKEIYVDKEKNGCVCFDFDKITCFAICGQFKDDE